ncbi:hypothetical protein AGABI1DRAFT_95002 [Agaricus bisporus var. burnettii JB137-S8]|uniref:Uncharacterized protein n=1 Tax=Agaricus bisporus var. burnettii (strain JB137-S8 / ATCC MYA-4627 / FGSC 10392) TaxID=597362 RepID=K5WWR7_AGABU|nr:uncharacterized protein AGABI1DRAFT_95002 [Agaricus bisporus var. burnettii JB137-S8]EKM75248.1 hypothetical protein AGABI1DRAFT_95002 [Agaricus bisporus var. burnettii JB137-S8]
MNSSLAGGNRNDHGSGWLFVAFAFNESHHLMLWLIRSVWAIFGMVLDGDSSARGVACSLGHAQPPGTAYHQHIWTTYNCKEECVPITEACQDFKRYLRGSFRTDFHASEENAMIDSNESCVRLWLDFKRNSGQDRAQDTVTNGPTTHQNFIPMAINLLPLLRTLDEKWSIVQRDTGQQHDWDELLSLLSQIHAGFACYGMNSSKEAVVELWFDIWALQCLHFNSVKRAGEGQIACIGLAVDDTFLENVVPESFDDYIPYFKYFQQSYPERQVLICGPQGSRFAISTELLELVKRDTLTLYHCFEDTRGFNQWANDRVSRHIIPQRSSKHRDHHDETKWDWCRLKDCVDEEALFWKPSWWEHGCLIIDSGVRRREGPMTT